MYMGPIVAAPAAAVATVREPAPAVARRLTGLAVLAVMAPLMLVWLTLNAVFAVIALGARALLGAIDYAGTVALGR